MSGDLSLANASGWDWNRTSHLTDGALSLKAFIQRVFKTGDGELASFQRVKQRLFGVATLG